MEKEIEWLSPRHPPRPIHPSLTSSAAARVDLAPRLCPRPGLPRCGRVARRARGPRLGRCCPASARPIALREISLGRPPHPRGRPSRGPHRDRACPPRRTTGRRLPRPRLSRQHCPCDHPPYRDVRGHLRRLGRRVGRTRRCARRRRQAGRVGRRRCPAARSSPPPRRGDGPTLDLGALCRLDRHLCVVDRASEPGAPPRAGADGAGVGRGCDGGRGGGDLEDTPPPRRVTDRSDGRAQGVERGSNRRKMR